MNARAERWLVPGIAFAAVLLHLATAMQYGIFRDEFYYIACANRLAWGYVDHPPFSLAILALVQGLLGDGQFVLRIVPALVAGANVWLAGRIAREMGGGTYAQAIAALGIFIAPVFRVIGSYYSMNVFDHFFWGLALLLLARIISTGNPNLWLWFGVICGLGLLNKISVLFLGFGLVVGLALTPHRKHFRAWQLYAGGAIALLLFVPHLVWEWRHGWPMVEFTANAARLKNAPIGPVGFFLSQLLMMNPIGAPIWLTGLVAGFAVPALRPYRMFAWLFTAVFLVLALTYGKDYYLAPAFYAIIPIAAVFLARFTEKRRVLRAAIPAIQVLSFALLAPLAIPVLPIETFLKYQAAIGIRPPASERGVVGDEVPQHFSDRFGWEQMAQSVQSAMKSLTPEQAASAVIIAGNYGEAFALEYYGKRYGLPPAYTPHNNGFLWGPPAGDDSSVISINMARLDELKTYFGEVREIGMHEAQYTRGGEAKFPIYWCSQPKFSWAEAWPRMKFFI